MAPGPSSRGGGGPCPSRASEGEPCWPQEDPERVELLANFEKRQPLLELRSLPEASDRNGRLRDANMAPLIESELVGARLIAHAGSLMNLAKQPASTVQLLGAEKALFRALKAKHDTPKYGLIYHASLIGQAPPKHKGKIARVLAAKCSLAVRVDDISQEVFGGSAQGRHRPGGRGPRPQGGAAPGGAAAPVLGVFGASMTQQ